MEVLIQNQKHLMSGDSFNCFCMTCLQDMLPRYMYFSMYMRTL